MIETSRMTIAVNTNAKEAIHEALKKGMKIVGMQAESYAKQMCPIRTGLLRNSITFALSGEATNITAYTDDNGENPGKYEGTAPENGNGITLYLGSNVHYAPYVELGHHQQPGRFVPAIGKRLKRSWVDGKTFLRPAIEDHAVEYNFILISALNSAHG